MKYLKSACETADFSRSLLVGRRCVALASVGPGDAQLEPFMFLLTCSYRNDFPLIGLSDHSWRFPHLQARYKAQRKAEWPLRAGPGWISQHEYVFLTCKRFFTHMHSLCFSVSFMQIKKCFHSIRLYILIPITPFTHTVAGKCISTSYRVSYMNMKITFYINEDWLPVLC